MIRIVLRAVVTTACIACGGAASETVRPDDAKVVRAPVNEPLWVQRGCESGLYQARRVICGVGVAKGYADPSLARSVAEAQGRASIANSLKSNVSDKLTQDSVHTTSAADGQSLDQSDASRHLEQGVTEAVRGVRAEQSWISPGGELYVLVVMDRERFDRDVDRLSAAASPKPESTKVKTAKAPTPSLGITP